MCGGFKVLSANAYVMETACVTPAVPAAMQVNVKAVFLPGQLEGTAFSMTLG